MNNDKGSVIIWILTAIFLFAALSFVMMQGSRTSGTAVSGEQAKAYAKQLISQGDEIKNAVKRLQFRGCKDTDISFEYSGAYVNPTSPPGNKCHVFHPTGGGLTYKTGPANAYIIPPGTGAILFRGDFQVEGNGTAASDLMMRTDDLSEDVCIAINDLLNISNPTGVPPEDDNDAAAGEFIGTYRAPQADGIGDDGGHDLAGKPSFCADHGTFHYVHVLIAR